MSYKDHLANLPPYIQRAWDAYRKNAMRDNRLWVILDRAADKLLRIDQELSEELEAEADKMMLYESEDIYMDFLDNRADIPNCTYDRGE
jgi:hypothetical protein